MIFTATRCPDCGAFISRDIHMDAGGLPIWVCPICGVVHEDHRWYKEIDHQTAISIIGARKPLGLFVEDTGVEIIGIDNSSGDAWTEEFPDRLECLNWLLQEREEDKRNVG